MNDAMNIKITIRSHAEPYVEEMIIGPGSIVPADRFRDAELIQFDLQVA